jgi:pimeloyl-ACP methyl ester carboxylesterase
MNSRGWGSLDLMTERLMPVDRAHPVRLSMGGGIAQEVAAFHPHRLHTLTLIATGAAGERADPTSLPGMEPRVAATFEDPRSRHWHPTWPPGSRSTGSSCRAGRAVTRRLLSQPLRYDLAGAAATTPLGEPYR